MSVLHAGAGIGRRSGSPGPALPVYRTIPGHKAARVNILGFKEKNR